MNAKTAKLLRKFARQTDRNSQSVKRLWNATPTRFRNELRLAMKLDAGEIDAIP